MDAINLVKASILGFAALTLTSGITVADTIDSLISADLKTRAAEEGQVAMVKNNWVSQEVLANIVHRIMTAAGFDLKVVPLDGTAMWPAMARADNLFQIAVNPSPHQEAVKKYITDEKTVVYGGETGYVIEQGWYFPDYVMRGDPARGIKPTCPGLPDWKALNECVKVFATASTGGKGRYLGGDKSWEQVYGNDARIKNLNLNYTIEVAGSEAALAAEWKRAVDRGEPILSIMWTPHYLPAKYPMTRVQFPPYSDDCWGKTYACSWKDSHAIKAYSAKFPEKFPLARTFVNNLKLDNKQLNELLVAISEGKSAKQAADEWVEANTDVWTKWLPR